MPDSDLRAMALADPTPLTTQQLLREVAHVREWTETQIGSIGVRLDGNDRAVDRLQAIADKSPTIAELAGKVEHLKELFTQKTTDAETAVKAAFDAQEKSIAKTETGFSSNLKALDDKIDELRDRLIVIESHKAGAMDTKKESDTGRAAMIAGLGVLVGIGGLAFAVISKMP